MSLINGAYKIFNAQFIGQDADLLGGQPTANVAGHSNNTDSLNMVWNLQVVDLDPSKITLRNAAPSSNGAYASVDEVVAGAVVHGSQDATEWSVFPYPALDGHYLIFGSELLDVPSQFVWTLSNGDNNTPITLEEVEDDNRAQLWQFTKWDLD